MKFGSHQNHECSMHKTKTRRMQTRLVGLTLSIKKAQANSPPQSGSLDVRNTLKWVDYGWNFVVGGGWDCKIPKLENKRSPPSRRLELVKGKVRTKSTCFHMCKCSNVKSWNIAMRISSLPRWHVNKVETSVTLKARKQRFEVANVEWLKSAKFRGSGWVWVWNTCPRKIKKS